MVARFKIILTMSNIVNFLSARESCERKRGTVKFGDKQMSRIVAQKNPLICSHQRVVYKMITYLAIEPIENKLYVKSKINVS